MNLMEKIIGEIEMETKLKMKKVLKTACATFDTI